jgi:hypothetical protein
LIAKNFGTYVSLGNLGFFLKKFTVAQGNWLFPKEIGFSPRNNHVPGEKEFKLP